MKFEAIKQQMSSYSVSMLCRLFGVSRSGFYSWLSRDDAPRDQEEFRLVRLIEKIHQGSRCNYGSPRIARILDGMGETCSTAMVARLMRKYGIRAKTKRKFRHTTDSNHRLPVAPNKLAQNFTASRIGEKLVGDITYIHTDEGWLYLACVMDVFSRKIIGWKLRSRMTKDLVSDALTMAVRRAKIAPGALFHSDRGSQYASLSFRRVLDCFRLDQSMSRRANCYDNSMMESFFATLEKEFVHCEKFVTRDQAQSAIFEWIECYYNRERIHSGIGYLTPCQAEAMSA